MVYIVFRKTEGGWTVVKIFDSPAAAVDYSERDKGTYVEGFELVRSK
jgi:hypothetical protein